MSEPAINQTGATEDAGSCVCAIDDLLLSEEMLLTQAVCHPVTGQILLPRGSLLTKRRLSLLSRTGITTVEAVPYTEKQVAEAVVRIQDCLRCIETILHPRDQSASQTTLPFQEMKEPRVLQRMMRNQVRSVLRHLNPQVIEALMQLHHHHPDSARHSVFTSFQVMAMAMALQWTQEEILEAVLAALFYDVGKVHIPHTILGWPQHLNKRQWEMVHLHTLSGGKRLRQARLDSTALVALNHHEWYVEAEGKGYGGLTRFRDRTGEALGLDMDLFLAQALPRQLEIIQLVGMADMLSALQEIRSFRGPLPPLKRLIIMNSDARQGHFNPDHFRAWHAAFLHEHRQLLHKGMQFALPREMKRLVERGGRPFFELDGIVKKLSMDELRQLDLLHRLQANGFDLDILKERDGIRVHRLLDRGIKPDAGRLASLGISLEKKVKILLPTMEKRLNRDDLLRFGVSEKTLVGQTVATRLEQAKNGLSLPELSRLGIALSRQRLEEEGERLNKNIFYDLVVMEEIEYSRALVAVVREGDTLAELNKARLYNELDPLQGYLLNKIGPFEMDFSPQTTQLPDMSHLVRGPHWEPSPTVCWSERSPGFSADGGAGEASRAPEAIFALARGVTLDLLDRPMEAIAVYDAVMDRFHAQEAPLMAEQVARALFNKGESLGYLDRPEEAMVVYDTLVDRFLASNEWPIMEQVAAALLNKMEILAALGQAEEALRVGDTLVASFHPCAEGAIGGKWAKALVRKGVLLGSLNRSEEAIQAYDALIARFLSRDERAIAEQVATALFYKGLRLGRLNRHEEAIGVYDQLIARFHARTELTMMEMVARAFLGKGARLGHLERSLEAIQAYDDLIARFQARSEMLIVEQVASALFNKGARLGHLNRREEALAVLEDLSFRFQNRREPALKAILSKVPPLQTGLKGRKGTPLPTNDP